MSAQPYLVENGATVVDFLMVSFDSNWHLYQSNIVGGPLYYFTKVNGATLQVVTEGPTGMQTTYTYKAAWGVIPANTEPVMYVGVQGKVIHIPTHCTSQVSGNAIKCQ